jgi:hypothetical protein
MAAVSQALGRFRLSVTDDEDPLRVVSIRAKTRAALERAEAERTDDQKKALTTAYRAQAPGLAPMRQRSEALKDAIKALNIVSAQVLQERASHERPSTYLRERGSFLSKGEKVYAGTPRVLPPMPDDQMPNRLGLARWLVSPANPLTARVAVNRLWQQFFGTGLSKTSDDFGSQGEPPTHPEPLDWLAVSYQESGWNTKALVKMLVTSATFKQSSRLTPELYKKDPANRLYARGPRFRLDAEQFGAPRESVLAALRAEGVPVSRGYGLPLYRQPLFANKAFGPYLASVAERLDYRAVHCPNCERICDEQGAWLEQTLLLGTPADIDDIVHAFEKIHSHHEALSRWNQPTDESRNLPGRHHASVGR